ncbi:MAG: serine hydrolase [Bryobacteraceae bacterium]|nr:serine hydrolase [Bryobacteraceae bacterium]
MRPRARLFFALACAVVILASAFGLRYLASLAAVGTGYAAKVMCSGVFVSGRQPDSILAGELALDHPAARFLSVQVQRDRHAATAAFAGLVRSRAFFRPGLGCTLETGALGQLQSQPPFHPPAAHDSPWLADAASAAARIDTTPLALAVHSAFEDPNPAHPRRTRALLVVHNGRIAAERYAPGFDQNMPLQGWSMAKSVTNALVGILVGQGKLSVDAPAPIPEWAANGDPRRAITLDHLMRMSSGLAFDESYFDPTSDVTVMLYRRPDSGAYAASKPLAAAPGTLWAYSSGTTNIVSRIVRETIGGGLADYWAFPRRALFDRIGMRSAVLEPDASGVFVGSSFLYATARDWARFGLLYLNDGVWNGERILPEGWVRYSTTPAPNAPQGRYGAQVWLNAGEPGNPANRPWPDVPADAFHFSGFEGQHVVVIPSMRLVVVRLGLSQEGSTWNLQRFLADLLPVFGDERNR